MGSQPANIDFALIGHQDSWDKITGFVGSLTDGRGSLPAEKIAEVYSFMPPRSIFDIEVQSISGQKVKGCYIETFIPPDELDVRHWKKNVKKVQEAAACARTLCAPVASLGGFTSIVLEGKSDGLDNGSSTRFTTGNALTAALIVKGMEQACIKFDKPLADQHLLIIGATGDIGSACVQYFSGKVKKLLLCARQQVLLEKMEHGLAASGVLAQASADLSILLPQADMVIAITSSPIQDFDPSLCKKDVIICDAGYPKNLAANFCNDFKDRLFCGGMGQVQGGYMLIPNTQHTFYDFPAQNVAHGCMLESIVLAFEKMNLSFSSGRGNITPGKIERIYALALKHGITVAPFFNSMLLG